MATPISRIVHVRSILQPQLNPSKTISIRGHDCVKCRIERLHGCSWSSHTTHLRLEYGGAYGFYRKPVVIRSRMEKTIESVRSNFNSIRTGRANPSMLDKIEVEYYGTPVNLKSIAQISTPDASSLMIQPYDKSSLKTIEKAIVASNLGMTPNNDGEVIRMTVPQLTSERGKELARIVAKQAEERKENKLSEDIMKDLSSELQAA